MEGIGVPNDVPFRQDRQSTLREAGRLDVECFVRFEILRERPEELVGDEATVVVRKPVLSRLRHGIFQYQAMNE